MVTGLQKWKNRSLYLSLSEQEALPKSLSRRVLTLRGIGPNETLEILSERIPELLDSFLLKDMDKAVDCLIKMIDKKAKVLIHGDYDTDGMTSTAILLRALSRLGLECIPFIPNRLTDGYGLSETGVNKALSEKVDLVLTCDCGVQSFDEVDVLNEAGIDVIITDHHRCLAELPRAKAVVNPNRLDDYSHTKTLAGAGVALKLIHALGLKIGQEDLWQDYVDLAALGTVADSMSLRGENRSIVRLGLDKMKTNPSPGLKALMAGVKVDHRYITATDLAYKLSPKINAAGRLGDGSTALELLLTDNEAIARDLVSDLLEQNSERKEIEAEAILEANKQLLRHPEWLTHKGVVLGLKHGHAGVMGIIAQRLSEQLACPVVALMQDHQSDPEQPFWRGSARTYGSASVLELIEAAKDYTKAYGGHHAASGVSVAFDQLDDFRRAFQEAADKLDRETLMDTDRYFEFSLQEEDLTLDQVRDLERLEPFGDSHASPYFLLEAAKVKDYRVIGQDGQHLRLSLLIGKSTVTALYFWGAAKLDSTVKHAHFIVKMGLDRFRGKETIKLMVEDFAEVEAQSDRSYQEKILEKEKLYQEYKEWSGEELAAILGTELETTEPKKDVLSSVYLYLRQVLDQGPKRFCIADLTRALKSMYNINSNDFHVRRVLEIYREAGLIVIRRINEDELLLALIEPKEKVDLYATPTWKRLATST